MAMQLELFVVDYPLYPNALIVLAEGCILHSSHISDDDVARILNSNSRDEAEIHGMKISRCDIQSARELVNDGLVVQAGYYACDYVNMALDEVLG